MKRAAAAHTSVTPCSDPVHEATAVRAFDPNRLRRGLQRGVVRLGPAQFRIEGRHEKFYDVDLTSDVPCVCKDAEYHGRGCKHELLARLHNGDAALIQSLGDLLLAAEKRKEK
jgi:hypothetical protein